MGIEAKKREFLQLLKDYRSFHSAFGGALALDETHVRDASYGLAGLIEAGSEFAPRQRTALAESYQKLELALKVLKGEDFPAWLALLTPYLGDPGDPSVVARWREDAKKQPPAGFTGRLFSERHDRAIEKLAGYLAEHELYVVWPKRMTSREEKQFERRNDEFFALYERYRFEDRMSRNKAIETAAEHCGYGRSRGYEIVDLREGKAS